MQDIYAVVRKSQQSNMQTRRARRNLPKEEVWENRSRGGWLKRLNIPHKEDIHS
jgi:hypothetical protein